MALPSVTIGGNTVGPGYSGGMGPATTIMNPGIQPGVITGGSLVMPQTTYAAQPTYTTSYAAQPTYTTGTYTTVQPAAVAAVDVNRDGKADYIVAGSDVNRDGIPDAMEAPVTYTTAAPTYTTSYAAAPTTTYAAPTTTYAAPTTVSQLPTTTSMVAYPQTIQQSPFTFYPAGQVPAAPAPAPKKDTKVAKKKKAGSCACCCGPKKAPAKKK